MLEALCKNFVYTFYILLSESSLHLFFFSFTSSGVLQSDKRRTKNKQFFFQFYFSFCTFFLPVLCAVHIRVGKKCRHLQAHANQHTNTHWTAEEKEEVKKVFFSSSCQTRGRSRVEMMSMKKKQKMAIRQKMLCAKAKHIKPRAYARNKNFELEHSVCDEFKTECEKTRKKPKMHKLYCKHNHIAAHCILDFFLLLLSIHVFSAISFRISMWIIQWDTFFLYFLIAPIKILANFYASVPPFIF